MKRLSLFSLATLLAFSSAVFPSLAADDAFSEHIGLQLESLSKTIQRDMSGTLEKARNFGFKYVELVGDYNLSPASLKAELQAHGLVATSAHFTYEKFRDNPEAIAVEAAALGLTYAGCPSIPQRDALDEQGCRDAITVFNHAGEVLAAHGIEFFYHPHGYEFKPYGGGTLFDLLVAKTSPKFVHFQMDVFWIVHAGVDPVKLLERYNTRWVSMHLKDMKKDARTGLFNSKSPKVDFVPMGQGQIEIEAVLRTARKIGITSYFIEDESATPEHGIVQSVQYLRELKW
jgi:sugar phosphate isomerase/epimerase